MRVIKIVVLIVLFLILGVVALIFLLPDSAHMERQVLIEAPTRKIYQELVSFRNFNKWSPWAQKDESATYTYTGAEFGPGAVISWSSENPDLGNGSMQILSAEKNRRVVWEMRFDGYNSSPVASFSLTPMGDSQTRVTWAYDEKDIRGFSKIFMLGIDGFLGGDYEFGLQQLKERVESLPDFTFEITPQLIPGFYYIGVQDSSLNEPSLIDAKMAADFGELYEYINQNDLEVADYPMAMFLKESDFNVDFVCGVPVSPVDTVYSDRLYLYYQDTTLALVGEYPGEYDHLVEAHDEMKKFASYYEYDVIGMSWESYVAGYESESDTGKWLTNIHYPFR